MGQSNGDIFSTEVPFSNMTLACFKYTKNTQNLKEKPTTQPVHVRINYASPASSSITEEQTKNN